MIILKNPHYRRLNFLIIWYNFNMKISKVCFVSSDFSFFRRYLFNLAAETAKTNDVTVITDGQNITPGDLRLLSESNIHFEQLAARSSEHKLKFPKYIYNLSKIIKRVNPDHVFYTTIEISFFGSIITKFKSKRKSYFIITGIGLDFFSKKIRYKVLNLIYRLTFKINSLNNNNSYIFQNHDDQRLFLKAGFIGSNNSNVIGHFGIKLTNAIKTHTTESIRFFFAGRLVRSKGILELIEATQILIAKYQNFQTIVAGPDSFESSDSLSKSERELLYSSKGIKYLGNIDYENMYSLYQKYDVFVLPSYREGLSTVALEAAANGMPLIISDVPGCTECINNNGFLIQPRDAIDLAKKMERFIINPNLVKDFSQKSNDHIKLNYSTEKLAQDYLALMKNNTK